MSRWQPLDVFEAKIKAEIPLTRAMELHALAFDGTRFRMSAPLSANHNDKGTAFAGSLSGGANLAGWCLVNLLIEALSEAYDVVVVDAQQSYQRPVTADFTFEAQLCEPDSLSPFLARLQARGKARIDLEVNVLEAGQCAFQQRASYVALLKKDWLQKG